MSQVKYPHYVPDSEQLFQIGTRGIDIVDKPQDLDETELTLAQNAEISPVGGRGGIDQRPGMSLINSILYASQILLLHDVPPAFLTDFTPHLYASIVSGQAESWQVTTNGTTWTPATVPAAPYSNQAGIGYWKNYPKAVTVGQKMYFADGNAPIGIHQWDGTNDITLSTVPPGVADTTISTPQAPQLAAETS